MEVASRIYWRPDSETRTSSSFQGNGLFGRLLILSLFQMARSSKAQLSLLLILATMFSSSRTKITSKLLPNNRDATSAKRQRCLQISVLRCLGRVVLDSAHRPKFFKISMDGVLSISSWLFKKNSAKSLECPKNCQTIFRERLRVLAWLV